MSYDTLGMIRRGWQDGVATVAPHVPGLADLLEQRLAEAIRLGRLDEAGLLSIVDAATQLAADLGSVDVAPALSKRLRRHVYEYLLSLDALTGSEDAAFGEDASPNGDAGLIETDAATGPPEMQLAEVAISGSAGESAGAHRYAPVSRIAEAAYPPPEMAHPEPEPAYPAPESRVDIADAPRPRDEAMYSFAESPAPLRESTDTLLHLADPMQQETGSGHEEREDRSRTSGPQFSFHIGDPDDLLTSHSARQVGGGAADAAGPAGPFGADGVEPPADGRDQAHRRASFADPSTWPKPVAPTLKGMRDPLADGLREELLSPDDLPASAIPEDTHLQDAGPWDAAPAADPAQGSAPPDLGRWSSPGPSSEEGPIGRRETAMASTPPAPGAPVFEAVSGAVHHDARPSWREATEGWLAASPASEQNGTPPHVSTGWAVRQPGAVELHMTPAASAGTLSPSTNDVPERDLVALRASVNQKLRKKRCDDVAAVLQQAAQELGGQAVAELALDAGDRCRSLGKRNAALNCYLAASRADPIYEPPLARLADICIDDQDIDLAVSYLERIARLTRLRGDSHGALRIYRKIATIAPYRDDVLEMLMRAQTTGKMES